MSSEPLIDIVPIMARQQDGAIITQFDYPMCEALGLVKMDFLGLRNLTVLDDALVNIKRNRDVEVVLEDLAVRRPRDLRAAVPRRHPRRVPARWRSDAVAAAQHAARQVRGHLRGQRALPAGPDGRRLAQQVRPPQERQRADRADPPRARRRPRVRARRDLRPDRLPRAGHGDRAGAGRLLARRRRQPAARDGQEEEGGARQAVRRLRGRHVRARLLPGRGQDAVGDPASRSPTTRSTRRTRRPTASSPTGPPTSRPTTRPSTWRRCSPR